MNLHNFCSLREDCEIKNKNMNWIKTSEQIPLKTGKSSYEQIACLVVRNGDIRIAVWNFQECSWDTEDGDDFLCEASGCPYWAELPELPNKKHPKCA